jgi:hypothetical protein
MSNHKTVMERVEELEKTLPVLAEIVNQQLNQRFSPLIETIDALTDIVGKDAVISKMAELQNKRNAEAAERQKAQVEVLLAEGRLTKAEKVSEKSLLVGVETDMAGNVTPPGRFQVTFDKVAPVFQEKLYGKPVGTKVEVPNAGGFELSEIYDFVDLKKE